MEQWNETNDAAAAVAAAPVNPTETRNFWQGHRFLNFLLACMVFAFVISWLFHFNVPSWNPETQKKKGGHFSRVDDWEAASKSLLLLRLAQVPASPYLELVSLYLLDVYTSCRASSFCCVIYVVLSKTVSCLQLYLICFVVIYLYQNVVFSVSSGI